MSDEIFSIPNPPDAGFINDCEFRVLSKPDTPLHSAGLCKLISMETQFKLGVTPRQCAHCRRNGEVDQDYIRGKIIAVIRDQLNLVLMGFYAMRPQEDVEALFLRAYKHFITPKDKQVLIHHFTAAVATKKLCKKWADEFVRTKMPDLLTRPGREEVTAVHPELKVQPAKPEDRALDVDFGCCGGRNIFRMLRGENLVLTAPNEEEFTVRVQDIASLVPLSNSNVPYANTMIRLNNSDVLMARETKEQIAVILKDIANAAGMGEQEEASLTAKMLNAGKSMMDIAKSLYGKTVDQAEYDKRKAACESCTATDGEGEKLFRSGSRDGWFSCGKPFWRKPLRDRSKDGCGCWLHIKWGGVDQHCPLKEPRW